MSQQIEQWIRQLLESRLENWARTQDLCVAFENVKFERPVGKFYLRAALQMASAIESDMVDQEEHSGLFLMDVLGPVEKGTGKHGKIVGDLRNLFRKDTVLSDGRIHLHVTSPLRTGPAATEPDSYMVPTWFEFRTQV